MLIGSCGAPVKQSQYLEYYVELPAPCCGSQRALGGQSQRRLPRGLEQLVELWAMPRSHDRPPVVIHRGGGVSGLLVRRACEIYLAIEVPKVKGHATTDRELPSVS